MNGCELNIAISALACAIAKDKSKEQLTILSVFFTQLGDSLATIAAADTICKNQNDENITEI